MAKVWKKLQRSDSDYTGDVTGTIDGTAASTVKGGAAKANLGLTALGVVDLATPVAKGGTGETTSTPFLNSKITTKADGGLNYDGTSAVSPDIASIGGTLTVLKGGTGATANTSWLNAKITTKADGGLNYDGTSAVAPSLASLTGTTPIASGGTGVTANTTWLNAKVTTSADGTLNYDGTTAVAPSLPSIGGTLTLAKGGTGATSAGGAKTALSLDNVDNTTDLLKPPSTAQIAVNTTIGDKNNMYKQDGIPNGASETPAVKKGDLWMDTNDSNKMYIAGSDGSDAITSGEWQTLKGNLALAKADVGLPDVVNQKISINSTSKSLEIDDVAQALNATLVSGDSSATIKAAAVTTAEGNIIGGAPGTLNTLDEIAAALNDNPTYITSTIVDSIATKGKAPIVITDPATAPTLEAVGQIGTYGDQMYVVQDI